MDNVEQRISQVESFMVLAPLAILDVVDVALLFAGLDDFFIIDAAAFPLTQFYFRMKGVRANYMLASNALELIPYVGKLPMRTIGAFITIRAANHPEGLAAEALSVGGAVVRKKIQRAEMAAASVTPHANSSLVKEVPEGRRISTKEKINPSPLRVLPLGKGENPSPQAVPSLYERENFEEREAA